MKSPAVENYLRQLKRLEKAWTEATQERAGSGDRATGKIPTRFRSTRYYDQLEALEKAVSEGKDWRDPARRLMREPGVKVDIENGTMTVKPPEGGPTARGLKLYLTTKKG